MGMEEVIVVGVRLGGTGGSGRNRKKGRVKVVVRHGGGKV